jgi:hypothetical protein
MSEDAIAYGIRLRNESGQRVGLSHLLLVAQLMWRGRMAEYVVSLKRLPDRFVRYQGDMASIAVTLRDDLTQRERTIVAETLVEVIEGVLKLDLTKKKTDTEMVTKMTKPAASMKSRRSRRR